MGAFVVNWVQMNIRGDRMKRLLLLLACLLALCTGVCAAEPVISEMKTDCTLTGSSSCQVTQSFTLEISGAKTQLRFPLSAGAKKASVAGYQTQKQTDGDCPVLVLTDANGFTGTRSFTVMYTISGLASEADGVQTLSQSTASMAFQVEALSVRLFGFTTWAIIGPQLVIFTRDAVAGTPYVGSFLSQALLPLIALPILLMLRTPRQTPAEAAADSGRTVLQLLAMPRYALAVAAGVVSYGVMAFVMTAAPVAMVNHGHSVDNAALGIQWHLLAMFGPSFFTGRLMVRYGKERVTAVGMVLLAASGVVALGGLGLSHFWGSLALLGIGWNFSFIGATAVVTDCHTPAERGKAQGMNDFFVFAATAAVSFLAGSILHSSGWQAVNWMIFPALALILVPLLWQGRYGCN